MIRGVRLLAGGRELLPLAAFLALVGCAGVELCLVMPRSLAASRGARDCARQAIPAGVPTRLTNSDDGRPKRLLADDPGLL